MEWCHIPLTLISRSLCYSMSNNSKMVHDRAKMADQYEVVFVYNLSTGAMFNDLKGLNGSWLRFQGHANI